MRRTALALAALSLPLIAAPARAGVVEVTPSSPWNVDFAENKCRLARFFGEGENRHLLFFEQYWPDARVGLTAAGPGFRRFASLQRTELKFSDSQEPRDTKPFAGKVANYGDAVVFSTLPMGPVAKRDEADPSAPQARVPSLDKAHARAVEFVSLKQRGDEVRLMTGPLDRAFEVLDQCALDLIGTWGLDVEQHRTATRLPRWTNRDAVVRRIVAVYPRDAAAAGEQGIMRMRVIVSPEGAVEDCAIVKATETLRLDSPACRAMTLARFEPGLDAAGNPMRSYFSETIVYQMGR